MDYFMKTRTFSKEEKDAFRSTYMRFDHTCAWNKKALRAEVLTAMKGLGLADTTEDTDGVYDYLTTVCTDGYVTYVDFEKAMTQEILRREHEDAILREVFQMFDLNKDGYIGKDELIRILMAAGDDRRKARATADELLAEAGCRHEGKVNFKAFVKTIRGGK